MNGMAAETQLLLEDNEVLRSENARLKARLLQLENGLK